MKLKALAAQCGLTIDGDEQLEVMRVCGLEQAAAGDISYVSDKKSAAIALESPVVALVAPPGIELPGKSVLRSERPRLAMIDVTLALHPQPVPTPGIDPRAVIGEGAEIDPSATIEALATVAAGARVGARTLVMAGAYVGRDASVDEDCLIHPNVSIGWGCVVGKRVILHSGTVLGSDGFGYEQHEGRHIKVPHVGNVVVGDDVEMGGNNTIDRAVYASTLIGEGTKIDNGVHIAHNVQIGRHSLILGQVGIAGSSVTGAYTILAGQSGILDHCTLADHVTLGPKSVITKSAAEGEVVYGYPAIPHRDWQRQLVQQKKLSKLSDKVNKLWSWFQKQEG